MGGPYVKRKYCGFGLWGKSIHFESSLKFYLRNLDKFHEKIFS